MPVFVWLLGPDSAKLGLDGTLHSGRFGIRFLFRLAQWLRKFCGIADEKRTGHMIHTVNRISHLRTTFVVVSALVLTVCALDTAGAQTERKPATEGTTAQQPAVQKPAVAPKKSATTSRASGITMQGDKLKAAPGFVLETKTKNQVSARRIGGGLGVTMDCVCQFAHGSCDANSSDDVAVCVKSAGAPCGGKCNWVSGSKGGAAARGTTGVGGNAPLMSK